MTSNSVLIRHETRPFTVDVSHVPGAALILAVVSKDVSSPRKIDEFLGFCRSLRSWQEMTLGDRPLTSHTKNDVAYSSEHET